MRYSLVLITGLFFSLLAYSQDLLVSMDSSSKHRLWVEKPAELCEVIVKNNKVKGALFLSCDTSVVKVWFMEPGILDIKVEIEPVKIGFTPIEEERNNHAVYVAARAKISEMESSNKKFKKELEGKLQILFDEKADFLSDVMFLVLPIDTEFTMYAEGLGSVKGNIEQLRSY